MSNDKMLALMSEVNGEVAEREELVEAIAIALLTRKNLFVLGDTGQAKSQVINLFRQRIKGARQFERLLSKQADEEQLFGRIDLSTLIPGNADVQILEQDVKYQSCLSELMTAEASGADADEIDSILNRLEIYRRMVYTLQGNKPKLVTTGKIPDSHIVFLDEIFKANDGILNALLTALNERRFTNEGETVDIPVISFFAASNEIPNFNDAEDAILKPLYDRLELKLVTEYVQDKAARLSILKNKQKGNTGKMQNTISLNALCQMQDDITFVTVPDEINELMDDVLCELRDKGVHVSDRKFFGYFPLVQAYAWLYGRTTVVPSDMLILRHYLWTNPEDRIIVKQLLERKCINPLKETLDDILKMASESYEDFEDSENTDMAKRIGKLRSEFTSLYENLMQLSSKAQSGAETSQIEDAISQIEELNRKAHSSTNYTYTPLNELLMFSRVS